jgi:hypothetical protein
MARNNGLRGQLISAFAGAHIATVVVGFLSGTGDASPSVGHILGEQTIGRFAWSCLFVLFGAIALWSNIRGRMRVEATAILGIAGGFALWALMIFADPFRSSLQVGFAFVVIALIKAGWGMTLLWWISSSLIFMDAKKLTEKRDEGAGPVDR